MFECVTTMVRHLLSLSGCAGPTPASNENHYHKQGRVHCREWVPVIAVDQSESDDDVTVLSAGSRGRVRVGDLIDGGRSGSTRCPVARRLGGYLASPERMAPARECS